MKKWTLVTLMMLATVSVAMGSLTVQLVPVAGEGYIVDGKDVQLLPGATTVTMELRGTFTASDSTDKISIIMGDVVSKKVGDGVVSAGSIAVAIDTDFDDPGYSGGFSQELTAPADGVLDNGYKGAAAVTGGVDTWTQTTDATANWVKATQATAGNARGDQVLAVITLNISSLVTGADLADKTQVQWYFRTASPSMNQSFVENGLSVTEAFGTTLLGGAPVNILVPEPVSIVLLAIGGLGLLRRKS